MTLDILIFSGGLSPHFVVWFLYYLYAYTVFGFFFLFGSSISSNSTLALDMPHVSKMHIAH